jgi:hypothetical protein
VSDVRGGFLTGRGVVPLGWVLVVAYVIWVVAERIVTGRLIDLGLAGLGLVVLTISLRILANWRDGFYLFIILLLFEDLIRKYLFNNPATFFAKDVLVAVTYLSFLAACGRGQAGLFRPPFGKAFGLFALVGAAQVLNPSSPHILFGLMGLKLYFFYAPLIFVTYELIRTDEDLRRFLTFNLVLTCLITGLGLAQSIMGLDFLGPRDLAPELQALGHSTRYSPISNVAVERPTSVFVSDGRFSVYCVMTFVLASGAAVYFMLRPKTRDRTVAFAAVVLSGVAAVMTGSRGAFVYVGAAAAILSLAFFWGAPFAEGQATELLRAVRKGLILAALGFLIALMAFPKQVGARLTFYSETLLPDSPNFEAANRAWDYPLKNLMGVFSDREWVLGYGIGTSSLGTQYVSKFLRIPDPGQEHGTEEGFGTLIIELGIIGPILWIAWALTFAITAWFALVHLRQKQTFPVAVAAAYFGCLLLFPLTWAGLVQYQNYVTNAYFWMLAGVLFRLPGLEADRARKISQQCRIDPVSRSSRPS